MKKRPNVLFLFAETSIDFDEAEKERTVRDAALIELYPPLKHNNYKNLYNLSGGRLINAESHLYTPDSPGHSDEVMKRE
ncbi:MAG: hypothetical protein ACLFST_14275 [Spirochaetia bacterium]